MTIEANKFRRKSALCRFMHGQPTKKLSISLDDAVTAGQRQARSKRTTKLRDGRQCNPSINNYTLPTFHRQELNNSPIAEIPPLLSAEF